MFSPLLSTYPDPKVRMACEPCQIEVQYDRDDCVAAGGDRSLLDFKDEVREKKGCKGYHPSGNPSHTICRMMFTNILEK